VLKFEEHKEKLIENMNKSKTFTLLVVPLNIPVITRTHLDVIEINSKINCTKYLGFTPSGITFIFQYFYYVTSIGRLSPLNLDK